MLQHASLCTRYIMHMHNNNKQACSLKFVMNYYTSVCVLSLSVVNNGIALLVLSSLRYIVLYRD